MYIDIYKLNLGDRPLSLVPRYTDQPRSLRTGSVNLNPQGDPYVSPVGGKVSYPTGPA